MIQRPLTGALALLLTCFALPALAQGEKALLDQMESMNDTAIAMAGKDGNLQLNTLRPLVISNLLRSIRLLADACDSFATRMLAGAELNRAEIEEHLGRSAMLVTALAPHIGYDRAASIAHLALEEDLPLREAALRSGVATALFDEVVRPLDLTRPGSDAP